MALRKQEHIEQITERCLIAPKKSLVSRNELREIQNIGARDVKVFIANFLLQVREFVFNLCLEHYFNENSRVMCNKQLMS